MNVAEPRIYEFDDFRLDAGRRLLLQRGEPVPLKPRVFDTLLYLARQQGRVIEKDELMRAIWPDAIVEENNLNASGVTWARWDGSGTVERLPAAYGSSAGNKAVEGGAAPAGAVPWSFSPDGKWLAFHRNQPQTGWDLWAAPVDRTGGALRLGPPQPLLRQPGIQAAPAISPDGRWLAYGSDDETGRAEIYVMPFSPQGPPREGKWRVSTDGGRTVRWSHNGDEIFFRAPDDRLMAAAVTAKGNSFQADKPRVWSAKRLANVGISPNFDVAPDGKRIVALFDAEETKPDETHLRILLNVDAELRRQRTNRRKAD